ncbi:MAG: hypothetical protein QOG20_3002 [Pseudonocardiales bacterium]|jgi:hypothetical protein|nr:hypothetical protein [Pseudonocardiales bacterium]
MPTCRRGAATAAGLADELEVSVATARRDLEALSAAVIPVYPQPGRGGGWSLPGGARTDLTALTAPEAQALFGESAEAPHSYYDGHAEQTAFVLARVPPNEDERVAPEWAGLMRRRPARAAALVERGGRGGPAVRRRPGHGARRGRRGAGGRARRADHGDRGRAPQPAAPAPTPREARPLPRTTPFASREGPRVTFGMRPPCRTLLRMSVRLNRQGDQVEPRSHPRR